MTAQYKRSGRLMGAWGLDGVVFFMVRGFDSFGGHMFDVLSTNGFLDEKH